MFLWYNLNFSDLLNPKTILFSTFMLQLCYTYASCVFGCIKTAQVRRWIRWWHHFSSNLGSHVCAEQLFHCGKKCVYLVEYEGFSSDQSTNIPNDDLCCGCRFHWTITTQVHVEMINRTWNTTFNQAWPQEGPGDEVILASVCNLT